MKKCITLMLVIAMLFAFSACATPQPETSAPTEAAAPQPNATPQQAAEAPAQSTGGTISLWSHWADEKNKVDFVMKAVENFKAKNEGWEVEVTWYQKDQLIQSLTAALQSGTGPDIFYLEPAITGGFPPFVDSGFMYDLTNYLKPYITDGAMNFSVTGDGMIYLLPLEAYTPFVYYNKDILTQAGAAVGKPAMDMAEFADALAKIKTAGYKGLAAGTMDRAWAGSILTEMVILRYTGVEKWQGIANGETAWNDPQVEAALRYVDDLVKKGYFPDGVASIKLGESHGIFFSGEYGMFPMKSFFGGRAFVPVESGGMREDFPLGIMDMPTLEGGTANNINFLQIGGSFGVNAGSQNPEKAAELLVEMAQPEMANLWMTEVKGQTGIKGDASALDDPYLQELNALVNSLELIPGPMELGMNAEYRDVFFTTSTALVAGQISVEDMIAQLEDARAKANG